MDESEKRVKAIMANFCYNIPFNCVVSHRDREMKTFSFIKDFEGGCLYRFCRVCNERVEPRKVKAHFETHVKKCSDCGIQHFKSESKKRWKKCQPLPMVPAQLSAITAPAPSITTHEPIPVFIATAPHIPLQLSVPSIIVTASTLRDQELVVAPPPIPIRAVIILGGIWPDRIDGDMHSDTARFSSLHDMLLPDVALFSVLHGPTTPLNLDADLRYAESWVHTRCSRDGSIADTIMSRGCKVFILDYFYTPRIYLTRKETSAVHGYGADWGHLLLPTFFWNGGWVTILPHDKWNLMREMLTESRTTGYSFMPLSNREARLYNPLYAATERITDPNTGTLNGTDNCNGDWHVISEGMYSTSSIPKRQFP
jgi:hypothetical protein